VPSTRRPLADDDAHGLILVPDHGGVHRHVHADESSVELSRRVGLGELVRGHMPLERALLFLQQLASGLGSMSRATKAATIPTSKKKEARGRGGLMAQASLLAQFDSSLQITQKIRGKKKYRGLT